MLFKLVLMRLLFRAKRVSQFLTLLCQIVMVALDILVTGHDDENMETAQEDSVEEFDDPGVGELDLIINELEESVTNSSDDDDDTKMFKCSKCGNSFITLAYLSQHKNAVHAKPEIAIDLQEEEDDFEDDEIFDGQNNDFAEESPMIDDEELTIEPVEHQDTSMKKPKTATTASKKKRERNRKKTEFECPHCGKYFKNPARLADHEIKKHKDVVCVIEDSDKNIEKGDPAENEDQVLLEAEKIKMEMDESFEGPPLKKPKTEDQNSISCSKCGQVFNSLQLLSKHKNEMHSKLNAENKPKNKTCEECEKTFFNVQYYEDHVVSFHTKAFPHLCDLCGKGFTVTGFRGRYREHRKNCLKEPRKIPERICKECGKNFPSSSSFNRHMIFHSKAKDYQCTDCEKAYADKNNLKNHVKLAHPLSSQQFDKEKKRPCKLCDKRFETHTKVELHKIEEHGQNYFAFCEVCGKGFLRREYIRRLEVHKKKCST